MTDFAKLEEIIKARTPGPWQPDAESREVWHGLRLIATVGYQGEETLGNRAFIATMGTLADLMLDVIVAALKVQEGRDLIAADMVEAFGPLDLPSILREPLAALRAAVQELP